MTVCILGLTFTSVLAQEISIPTWIKNNAGWWANDQIPDSAFVQGIQYLINEGIIVIPLTSQETDTESTSIPAWIKNNAGWWANDQIPDSAFVQGIEYLIKVGIIIIGSPLEKDKEIVLVETIIEEDDVKIHYKEFEKILSSEQKYIFIEIQITPPFGEKVKLTMLKVSEQIVKEEGNKKTLEIGCVVIKDNGERMGIILHTEEFEGERIVRYIESLDQEVLFRQFTEPKNYFNINGILSTLKYDFALKSEKQMYNDIGVYDEVNKPVIIIPTFTTSAYGPNGFYAYYSGNCDDQCLTTKILSDDVARYTSSDNAVKILKLLGYDSISDMELHTNPNILKKYDKVIVLHNEYVSRTMFDAITSHDNVIFLYPNALYAQVNVDTTNNLITLVRGHNYPSQHITNGFDWKNENTHPYEYDSECKNWEFYPTTGMPNGYMLNCYPENIILKDRLLLKTLKDL